MGLGSMLKTGDVVLAKVQFTDTSEVKTRPALVLFEEFDNIVVAGITSNEDMKVVRITKKDGAIKDSVFKLNYKFTIVKELVSKIKRADSRLNTHLGALTDFRPIL